MNPVEVRSMIFKDMWGHTNDNEYAIFGVSNCGIAPGKTPDIALVTRDPEGKPRYYRVIVQEVTQEEHFAS